MTKVDYVKINNTIRYIQNVAYLSELPVANENSADFVSVNNELYVKQVNGATYTYAKVGGSGGATIIEAQADFNGKSFSNITFDSSDFDKALNDKDVILNIVDRTTQTPFYLTKTYTEGNYAVLFSAIMGNKVLNGTLMSGMLDVSISDLGGGSQETIVADMSWFTSESTGIIPQEYRDIERLKNARLIADVGGSQNEFRFMHHTTNYQFVSLTTYEGSFDLFRIDIYPDSGWTFNFYTERYNSGSGSGIAFIDITGLDILPTQYQNEETLKTAILFDTDHLLRLTWIDDMYYFGNTDDFQYRYLSIDTSDWVIMRYDLQEIAKAPKVVNLNTYVPSTATNGTLDSSVLATLQASDSNYIVFNNEIFKLADKQHNEGYLVYSHNGHDTTGCFFQKCITITLSTRGWVLEEQENQPKLESGTNIKTINNQSILGSGNITIEGGGSGGESANDTCELVLDVNNLTEEQLERLLIILPTIIDACSSGGKLVAYFMTTGGEGQEYITVNLSINDLPSDFLNKFNNAKYFKLAVLGEGMKVDIATLPLRSKNIDNNIEQFTGEFSTFGVNVNYIVRWPAAIVMNAGAVDIYANANELVIGMYAQPSEIANVS